jgi:hypothetical protein
LDLAHICRYLVIVSNDWPAVNDDEEDEEREERTKRFLLDEAQRAIDLRSKDREFHGLEREFLHHQAQMLIDYNKSKDIQHPRDLGDTREQILRKFLLNNGLLPRRYGVSQTRARVASTTGHATGEMDIVLFDPIDSISLMIREGIYETLPVESVYGIIQVKSRLNKREINDGLENVASFKRLHREPEVQSPFLIFPQQERARRGFGLLFAYDSDLDWLDIIREIEAFSKARPNAEWCNGIFILNKGAFFHGDETQATYMNLALEKISKRTMHGRPDRQNQCLYQFYSILLHLLRTTEIQPANANSYFRLPLVADALSYEFSMGAFAELGRCEQHGDYQRKITPDKLRRVIDWCKSAEPINWIKATDIAYGKSGDNLEAYARQPGDVRIYNPENLPLTDILVMDRDYQGKTIKVLAYDQIQTAGMVIYIPYYYTVTEGIISGCPKCPPPQIPPADSDPKS